MKEGAIRLPSRGPLVLMLAVGVIVLYLVVRGLLGLYIEVLWFTEVGYTSIFWKRALWLWGGRGLAALLVAATLFLNLRYAASTLGKIQIKRRFGNLEISEQLPKSYIFWGTVGGSCLFGLWFGGGLVSNFLVEHVLLAIQGVEWGLVDPIIGRDASFYVFALPLLEWGISLLLMVAFLILTVCAAGYAASGSIGWGPGGVIMQDQPRIHLGALVASFVFLLAARFWIARYLILQDGNSAVQGIVGYADVEARLGAYRILAVLAVLSALLILFGSWRNRLVPVIAGVGTVVVGGLIVTQLYPSLVQRIVVEPNELERETLYIEHNLAFTRMGFGLDQLTEQSFVYADSGDIDTGRAMEQLDGLPVWSANTLLTTFRELEARFEYYNFETVAVDRYDGPDGLVPIAISVRELDPAGVLDVGWQNNHLRERYVRGMGIVASPAALKTTEGRPPFYVSSLPPEFAENSAAPSALRLRQPAVYVGSRSQLYAVISPTDSTFLSADGDRGQAGIDFPEGIQLDSFFRRLALAWYNGSWDLLFSDEVVEESHFVMRRHVRERVTAIAPFLQYPDDPYPVVFEGRVVWVLEALTATRFFPLSSPQIIESRREASYVRNSVKVIVDAVTGEVTFYAMPESDPLLAAYVAAFPGLLTPFEEMPRELRRHLRYPRSLLDLQARVLLRYHQDSPPVFHGQQDVWALPLELFRTTSPVPYSLEYGRYRLPGDETEGFYLTTVFVPEGRQNLTALLAGEMREDGQRSLRLIDVLVEDPVPGPRQVEALVEQDPLISQQFSLWRTGGSQVWTGHLHLVPVGERLIYMEPVFLAAEANAIPELRRFVVSDGRRVAMEETLEGAIGALLGDLGGAVQVGAIVAPDMALPQDRSQWPAEALEALNRAEERLREGDWQGFGIALEELRLLLEGVVRLPGG